MERLSFAGENLSMRPAEKLPERIYLGFERRQTMRYGENPHQSAALYVPAGEEPGGLAGARQLQGKELSYNNFADLDAAWGAAREFEKPAAVIVKHNNPCGVAEQDSLAEAYRQALACDPVSAFGGVMAFNRPLDAETAADVAKLFVECIVAPGYRDAARELLAGKKNLRLLELRWNETAAAGTDATLELKRISGGLLLQEPDRDAGDGSKGKVVTKRAPSEAERRELAFAWKVCKHVKSNAIVFTRAGATLGIGAGQMSRVDSVRIAVMKAQLSLAGSVVASDAFFPFPDGVEEAGRAGAVAVIQPGGSMRDNEVIAAADAAGIAMIFTGVRHFRH
jgi:phosphoribosylaminoimidazolecarboxamide formyltransferase / IMP cyclohydrolase